MISEHVSALFIIVGLGLLVISGYEGYDDTKFMWRKYKRVKQY